MAALTMHEGGGGADTMTGRAVFEAIFDLLRHSLPRVPLDDPCRPALASLAPQMQDLLGRPRVLAVPTVDKEAE